MKKGCSWVGISCGYRTCTTVPAIVILPLRPGVFSNMYLLTRFTIIFAVVVFAAGCRQKTQNTVPPRYKNIIVLADAGKRLGLFRQAERDKAIIEKIYTHFESTARRHFFVNSKDRFQVLALPNAQTDNLLLPLQEQLYIDMQTVPVKEKARYIKNQQTAFLRRVDSFYSLAASVPEKQYSNTWKFFNEQLEEYLKPDSNFDNYIIVLSDGYSASIPGPDAEYTSSEALLRDARKSGNWEAFLAVNRLKPIVFPRANLFLFFAEMNGSPAFEYFPDELKLVQQTWLSWAAFCNSSGANKTLPRITEGSVNNEIALFLQNAPGSKTITETAQGLKPIPAVKSVQQEPVYLSDGQTPPQKQSVKKHPVVKPEPNKTSPEKKDSKGGYSIRQDF